MFECFKNISELLAHWATVITLIVLILSVCVAHKQLEELKIQRHWENFNAMNVRYAELLGKIPFKKEMKQSSDSFESVEEETKIWIRQYFDLYSEECWLNENGLLPKGMFNGRIRPGVVVNLKTYPILVDGYFSWKDQGAFNHPADFHKVVEEDINKARIKDLQDKPQYHCIAPSKIKDQSK